MSTAVRAATSGAIASMCALLVTFPLATAKVRMQAQRHTPTPTSTSTFTTSTSTTSTSSTSTSATTVITNIISQEGVQKLYAGLLPALGKQGGTNFIFYFFFDLLKRFFNPRHKQRSTILHSLLHGMSAGACVQMVMLPTDLVVTRLMATGSSKGYFATLFRIIQTDGVLSLWSGIRPGLALTVNPGLTTTVRSQLNASLTSPVTAWRNFLIGMVSKAVASTITYPYTLIKVQMQVYGMGTNNEQGKKSLTMSDVFNQVVNDNGVLGLWKGLAPQLTNAVLKEALLNMVRLEIVQFVEGAFNFLC